MGAYFLTNFPAKVATLGGCIFYKQRFSQHPRKQQRRSFTNQTFRSRLGAILATRGKIKVPGFCKIGLLWLRHGPGEVLLGGNEHIFEFQSVGQLSERGYQLQKRSYQACPRSQGTP